MTEETEEVQMFQYPNCTGIWGIEIDGRLEEVEVDIQDGELVVWCQDLEDIGLATDDFEECNGDTQYVLASSLGQNDGEDVWQLVD